MTNLIPPRAKKKLVLEYWTRAVSTWLSLWSVALVAGIFILLPAYVLIGSQVEVHKASAAKASEKVQNYSNTSRDLVRASQQAKLVIDETAKPAMSEFISLFESLQGEEISLTALSLGFGSEGKQLVTLAGIADNRQALATFRDQISAEEMVDSVNLPLSNLARDKDITFEIVISLNITDEV